MNDSVRTELFGDVDNLSCFVHPVFHTTYRFLSDRQLIAFAQAMCDRIEQSGRKRVVVSETGASPFAWLCEQILARRGAAIRVAEAGAVARAGQAAEE